MDIKAPALLTGQNAFGSPAVAKRDEDDMARAVCMVTLVLSLASAGPAAGEEATWLAALRHVLAHEQKCDLGEVLWSREVPVGKTTALEGRARCLDGREFDFTQRRPHMKFDVRLCQPTVC